jgi:hypothetical protein
MHKVLGSIPSTEKWGADSFVRKGGRKNRKSTAVNRWTFCRQGVKRAPGLPSWKGLSLSSHLPGDILKTR